MTGKETVPYEGAILGIMVENGFMPIVFVEKLYYDYTFSQNIDFRDMQLISGQFPYSYRKFRNDQR